MDRIPPVMSIKVEALPKVFTAFPRTKAPAPALVKATVPAMIEPFEIVPLNVKPCTTFDTEGVPTVKVAP